MKKTISFLLSLVIVLSGILTGCSENQVQPQEEEASSSPDAAAVSVPDGAEEGPADTPETEEILRDSLYGRSRF